jgi:hypothetical protein
MSISTSLRNHKHFNQLDLPDNWSGATKGPSLHESKHIKKEKKSYYTKERIKIEDNQDWIRNVDERILNNQVYGHGGFINQYARGVNKFATIDYGKGGTTVLGPLGKPKELALNEQIIRRSNYIKGDSDALSRQPVLPGNHNSIPSKNMFMLASNDQNKLSISKPDNGVILEEKFKLKDTQNNIASVQPTLVYNIYKKRKPDLDQKSHLTNKNVHVNIQTGKDTQHRFETNKHHDVDVNILNNKMNIKDINTGNIAKDKFRGDVKYQELISMLKAKNVSSNVSKNNLYKKVESDVPLQLRNTLHASLPEHIYKNGNPKNLNSQPFNNYKTTRNQQTVSNIIPTINIDRNKQHHNTEYVTNRKSLNMNHTNHHSTVVDPGKIWRK